MKAATMTEEKISYRLYDSFDPDIVSKWNELLPHGNTDAIFLTAQWQQTWWNVFGRGKLLIVVAQENEKPIAIAPLFADEGMVFFVGSGGSDYLDFIGNISNEDMLSNILEVAAQNTPGFLGFRFYHIPGSSKTSSLLETVGSKMGWSFFEEGELISPVLELKKFPEQASQYPNKKSLVRHQAWFDKNGGAVVTHLINGKEIKPFLKEFFNQHIERWKETPFPSLFLDEKQCLFYQQLCESMDETSWLRFTRIEFQDRSIAFHFGFNYKNSFLWYKPTFDISFAKHSPGEVLLRQLLLQANKEDAEVFDFGLGEEAFKKRFATNFPLVKTWGLYPASSLQKDSV